MPEELPVNLSDPKLFSKRNLKSFILVLGGLLGIIGIYYLFSNVNFSSPGGGMPPGLPPDGGLPPLDGGLGGGFGGGLGMFGGFNIWPLWGTLVQVSSGELVIAISVFGLFALFAWIIFKKAAPRSRFYLILFFGLVLMIGTNLIHGWETGIYEPIGGGSEIYYDAIQIDNLFDFIRNFVLLQPSLSLHAQTQPPGAVLFIYLFSLITEEPAFIAIMLATVATVGSAFFIRGIFKRWYGRDLPDYTVCLFLLLPAVQVYYLANIYAIVAMLILGVIYFYLHQKPVISLIGGISCLFLVTFTSFLSTFIILCLFLFEAFAFIKGGMLKRSKMKELGLWRWVTALLGSFRKFLVMIGVLVGIYAALYFFLGFNYLAAFSFASYLENPNGFMLISNPGNYFITRLQDVLDIVVFFGPVLFVLFRRGLKSLKAEAALAPQLQTELTSIERSTFAKMSLCSAAERYLLVIAALVALLILFLTGAPKKGETARICLFILPFLLIPVVEYFEKTGYSQAEKIKLLAFVFLQAVVLQVIATWLW